jgi:hypothetical protein
MLLIVFVRPISQSRQAANAVAAAAMADMATTCFDNMMSWFRSSKEGCWFPDYVVQKDASYGPVGGKPTTGTTGTTGTGIAVGPPWARGGGGGVSNPFSSFPLPIAS